ncbi:hypothetical protein [Variovorax sp. WS11]|uniref:hypothetical protein n=1 Tax=Variovorax sp. WS11 TaxID=1105204 RepID=UPI0011B25D92|nr:hypothetical protein [Variovorax sp. WS11]
MPQLHLRGIAGAIKRRQYLHQLCRRAALTSITPGQSEHSPEWIAGIVDRPDHCGFEATHI